MQQIGTVSELQSGSFLSTSRNSVSNASQDMQTPSTETLSEKVQAEPARLAPTEEERRSMQARIRHVLRRSLLTPDTLDQLGNADLSPDTLHSLRTMLDGPFEERWDERIVATWALGLANLTARQSQNISQSLIVHLQRRSLIYPARPMRSGILRRSLHLRVINTPDPTFFLASVYLFTIVLLYAAFVPLSAIGYHLLGMGTYLFLAGSLLLQGAIRRMIRGRVARRESRFRATVATALGRLGVPIALTPLARAAMDPDARVCQAAEPALRASLARLSVEAALETDPELPIYLCRLLERNRDRLSHDTALAEETALDYLVALEKIGDSRAIPAVYALINTGWTAPVNNAARRLLPLLLARQQQETDQRMLLRGAAMPVDPPETLLRPTDRIPSPDPPETLLRLPTSPPANLTPSPSPQGEG